MNGRALGIGLVASLALNLFIGGGLIGAYIQHVRQPPPPPPSPASAPAPVAVETPAPAPAPAPPRPAVKAPSPQPAPAPVTEPVPAPIQAPPPGQPGQPGGNPLLRAGDDLPPQIRGPYRAALRDAAEASRPKLAAARRARNEVARLMAQPNFDPAALTAALDRAREAEVDARSDVEAAMVKFAAGMTLQQRRILANGLRENPQGGRGGPTGPGGPQGFGQGPGRDAGPGRGGPGGQGPGARSGRGGPPPTPQDGAAG